MIQRNGFGKRQGDVQDARIIAGQYRQMVDPQLREVQRKRWQIASQLVFGEGYHAVHAGNIHFVIGRDGQSAVVKRVERESAAGSVMIDLVCGRVEGREALRGGQQ